MLSRLKIINSSYTRVMAQSNVNSVTQNRFYKIQISNTNPMSASSEQSEMNPIIQMGAKKVIQHLSLNTAICDKPGCDEGLCDLNKPDCKETSKIEAIGHGTHSDSAKVVNSAFLSKQDLTGAQRPQYGVFYPANKRTPVINADATKELNQNKEMFKKFND